MSLWRHDQQTGTLTSHSGPAPWIGTALLLTYAAWCCSTVAAVIVGAASIVCVLKIAQLHVREERARAHHCENGEFR